MLTLGLVFLFGATLILNTNKSDDSYDTISPKYSLNIFLSRKIGSTFGPTLILSSTICAFLFCIGFYSGQTKTTFAVRSDNKTILLRKYGDIIIYGSTINGKVIEIAISDSKVDTLHMTKFK